MNGLRLDMPMKYKITGGSSSFAKTVLSEATYRDEDKEGRKLSMPFLELYHLVTCDVDV